MTRIYGSLTNRLEEGRNFTGREIKVGDDITMYHYSDRSCYYVTKVIDQKHIFVKRYEVCANQEEKSGMGHQDWMYFKTNKEQFEYLVKFYPDRTYDGYESPKEEWVYRRNAWHRASTWTYEKVINATQKGGIWFGRCFTQREYEKLMSGKEVTKYDKLESVSFGVRSYYYDWEF